MDPVKLGYIVDDPNAARDAVHIAVIPVVASGPLRPGDHVGRHPDGTFGRGSNALGIVDPFMTNPVEEGQKFWLFLYPYSIKGIRHEWQHPDFPSEVVAGHSAISRADADKFITEIAGRLDIRRSTLIEGATDGGGIFAGDNEGLSWRDMPPADVKKFWDCLEIVTDQTFDAEHRADSYFSCSC